MARPKSDKYKDVAKRLNEYTNKAEIPVLAEFAYKNDMTREYLYTLSKDDEELFNAIKRCTEKKETVLEIGALKGKYSNPMAIFSLKQLGWRDKFETDTTVKVESDGFIEAIKGSLEQIKDDDLVEE